MKYEIKPEYRHLFDEEIRDKKLPLEKTVNEGLYGEAWNDHGLTKEALQPVADFQKGELLISNDHEFLIKVSYFDDNGFILVASRVYSIKYSIEPQFYRWANYTEYFHRPTDEELHDFLLGMVKATYNEGDQVRSLNNSRSLTVGFRITADSINIFKDKQELWLLSSDTGFCMIMKNGTWAKNIEQAAPNKVYISGKITGIEDEAPEIFRKAKAKLESKGYDPINPMELPEPSVKNWHNYMKNDIKALCDCDAICMLPNWKDSKGAILEHTIAVWLDLKVLMYDELG